MKLLAIITISLVLFTAAGSSAQTKAEPGSAADSSSSLTDLQSIKILRAGSQSPTEGPAKHFTGSVLVEPLFSAHDPARAYGARVTFEPGGRTAWHTHPLGQTLIVTDGTGWVQQWGGQKQEIRKGDVVWIHAGQKHWHGATAHSGMSHIAILEQLNGKGVEWMEKVNDAQYGAPIRDEGASRVDSAQPKPSQKAIGDFAPKLAELTDNVLYGDVWERSELSKRDRSLVTVAALIALNRPDQLRSHLVRARENGVTQDELIETITHLAFYAGWPNAVNAIGVAKEVFGSK